jgi:hypothetical protein
MTGQEPGGRGEERTEEKRRRRKKKRERGESKKGLG